MAGVAALHRRMNAAVSFIFHQCPDGPTCALASRLTVLMPLRQRMSAQFFLPGIPLSALLEDRKSGIPVFQWFLEIIPCRFEQGRGNVPTRSC